ncbi:MAG: alcohol dehydrogenase catalytic domain-containing protein [Victivallales bacterium]|nr:alcohol dehydrogenase catalytic domain-containing protein [Victivallales bacterium]
MNQPANSPMNAAQYIEANHFEIRHIPTPPLRDDYLRIRVAYCGICGTDLHIFQGKMDARVHAPQAVGHEISGWIEACGNAVSGWKTGEKVTVRPLDNDGTCNTCKAGFTHICEHLKFLGIETPGGFAEFWDVPARLVHRLPAGISMQKAALVEPLAVACHDVGRAGVKPGQLVLISGGGPIGMLNALVARHAGGQVLVSEVNETRLALARMMGFECVNPLKQDVVALVRQRTGGSGADVVMEVSGSAAGAKLMTELVRPRGTIVIVAIFAAPVAVDLHKFFWKEIRMVGARVYESKDFDKAIQLVDSGEINLDKMISKVFPMEDIQQAFDYLSQTPDALKVLIQCNEDK